MRTLLCLLLLCAAQTIAATSSVALTRDKDCTERSRECGIPCENGGCRSRYSWCVNDGECGQVCISKGHVCEEPEKIKNGQIVVHSQRWFGSKVTYKCDEGYEMVGTPDRNCQGDKKWSGKPPLCVNTRNWCTKPPYIVENGYANVDSKKHEYYVGENVTYLCDIGYSASPLAVTATRCHMNDYGLTFWSPAVNLKCQVKACEDPENIPNGGHTGSPPYHVGDRIRYACSRGYTLNGDDTRQCSDDQGWSGRPPSCTIKKPLECPAPERIENGYFLGENFKTNGRITYECFPGYILKGNPSRTCLQNQRWSGEPPICEDQGGVQYPSDIRIVSTPKNTTIVHWIPPDTTDTIRTYVIYRKEIGGTPPQQVFKYIVPSEITEVEVSGINPDRNYVYWVAATTEKGERVITRNATYKLVPKPDEYPPKPVDLTSSLTLRVGKSLFLTCAVEASPKPTRKWFKDGVPLKESYRVKVTPGGNLFFRDFQLSDSGKYTCEVENRYGRAKIFYSINTSNGGEPPFEKCEEVVQHEYDYDYPEFTSDSTCCFKRKDNVLATANGRRLPSDYDAKIPDRTLLKLRCSDIMKYKYSGPSVVTCNKGKWFPDVQPMCVELKKMDPSLPPVIEFEVTKGSYTIDDDGSLDVSEGAAVKLKCFWPSSQGVPRWAMNRAVTLLPDAPDATLSQSGIDLSISSFKKHHESRYRCCHEKMCNGIVVNLDSQLSGLPTTAPGPEPTNFPAPTPEERLNVSCKAISSKILEVNWKSPARVEDVQVYSNAQEGHKVYYWPLNEWDDELTKSVKFTATSKAFLQSLKEDTYYVIQVIGQVKSDPILCKTNSEDEQVLRVGTCRFHKTNSLISVVNGKLIASGYYDVPNYGVVESRCDGSRPFKMYGSNQLRCINGVWNGRIPICAPVNIREESSPPAVQYEKISGDVAINPNGSLSVKIGGALRISCYWNYNNEVPIWEKDGKNVVKAPTWNKARNSYDLLLSPIRPEDTGNYKCCTKHKECNTIEIKVSRTVLVKIYECSLPSPPVYGKVTGTSSTEKGYQKAAYECTVGYALRGDAERECVATGQWSGSDPKCVVNLCAIRHEPKNGHLMLLSGFLLNDRVEYGCDDGYVPYGIAIATCIHKDGMLQWTSPAPQCIATGETPSIPNPVTRPAAPSTAAPTPKPDENSCQLKNPDYLRAVVDGKIVDAKTFNFPDQSTVTLRCLNISSYLFSGDNVLKCNRGKWNEISPTCTKLEKRNKNESPVIEYSVPKSHVNDEGVLIIPANQPLELNCLWLSTNGRPTWKSNDASVQLLSRWNYDMNSYRATPRQLPVDEEVKFTCCTPTRKCNSIRVQVSPDEEVPSSTPPSTTPSTTTDDDSAEVLNCERPLSPENGYIHPSSRYTLYSRIVYRCDESYEMEGENTAVCLLKDGKMEWSHPPPECKEIRKKTCEISKPNNIIATLNNEKVDAKEMEFPENSIAQLRCSDIFYYKFKGDHVLKCEDGEWNGTSPSCERLERRSVRGPPTIDVEMLEGKYEIDNEGTLVVPEGAKMKLQCLWFKRYQNPKWTVKNIYGSSPFLTPGWNSIGDSYDVEIAPNFNSRDIIYKCETPYRHENSIRVKVKKNLGLGTKS